MEDSGHSRQGEKKIKIHTVSGSLRKRMVECGQRKRWKGCLDVTIKGLLSKIRESGATDRQVLEEER